jgi:hypothetical protein
MTSIARIGSCAEAEVDAVQDEQPLRRKIRQLKFDNCGQILDDSLFAKSGGL